MTFVAGQKLRASELNDALDPVADLPLGVVARHRRTTTSSAVTSSTEATAVGILRLGASVKAGRLYRVGCPQFASYGDAVNRAQAVISYTTNGVNPTTTSTLLTQSGVQHDNIGSVEFYPVIGHYTPPSDLTFTATLWLWRPIGTSNIYAYGGTPALDFLIEDMGVDPGSSGTTL